MTNGMEIMDKKSTVWPIENLTQDQSDRILQTFKEAEKNGNSVESFGWFQSKEENDNRRKSWQRD